MRHPANTLDGVWGTDRTAERQVAGRAPERTPANIGGRPPMRLALDQTLFEAGARARCLYLIERGAIRLEAPSSRWDRRVVALLGPGDVTGEECLGEDAYRYDAVAADATTVRSIDPHDTRAMEACLGPLVRTLLRQRRDAEARHADMHAPAMARLARCLRDFAERLGTLDEAGWSTLWATLRHRQLASYIGVSRVTATRMMGELRERGAVKGGHAHYRVSAARLRDIEERSVLDAL